MNLPNRQRLGAVVLIISGVAAFVAPFLIHSPPTQGNIGPGPDNGNNDNGETGENTSPPGGNPGGGGPKKKTLQDLKNAIGDCQTENDHGDGPRTSLIAKILSAMRAEQRAEHQTRTDQVSHHLAVLEHKLDTPSAEKHVGTCISGLKDLIGEMMTSS